MRHVLKALLAVLLIAAVTAVFHPDSPLPDQWNPRTPLNVEAPLSQLTGWKLRMALARDAACLDALETGDVRHTPQAPLSDGERCGIDPRITLRDLGAARVQPVETRCQTALRLAMWEGHGLQAAAMRHFGQQVREILHFSSYSCRALRTERGESGRMSTHARANAIDVSGFVLADGTRIDIRRDWKGAGPKSGFLRDAFAAACLWFPVALGPEYNALHADHFHLQNTGWGLCR